jgi:hypothetical protein
VCTLLGGNLGWAKLQGYPRESSLREIGKSLKHSHAKTSTTSPSIQNKMAHITLTLGGGARQYNLTFIPVSKYGTSSANCALAIFLWVRCRNPAAGMCDYKSGMALSTRKAEVSLSLRTPQIIYVQTCFIGLASRLRTRHFLRNWKGHTLSRLSGSPVLRLPQPRRFWLPSLS